MGFLTDSGSALSMGMGEGVDLMLVLSRVTPIGTPSTTSIPSLNKVRISSRGPQRPSGKSSPFNESDLVICRSVYKSMIPPILPWIVKGRPIVVCASRIVSFGILSFGAPIGKLLSVFP